jgi:hypothetical protein
MNRCKACGEAVKVNVVEINCPIELITGIYCKDCVTFPGVTTDDIIEGEIYTDENGVEHLDADMDGSMLQIRGIPGAGILIENILLDYRYN